MHRITAHLQIFLQFFMHMFIYILRCIFPYKVIENKVFLTYSKDGLLLIPQSHNLMQNAWRKYLCLSGNCLCPKSSNQYQPYVTFDAWQTFCLLLTKWKIAFLTKENFLMYHIQELQHFYWILLNDQKQSPELFCKKRCS